MQDYKIDDVCFSISRYCPGKCVNCNIWKEEVKKEDEINLSIYETILQSDILKDTFYFSLTGGEAQLSKKYLEVIKLISKYKSKAIVQSNISGWYPSIHYKTVKTALEYLGKNSLNIDISVDGIEEDYKKVRLTKNGWEKVKETTNLLQQLNVRITYVMIIHKQNYKSIEAFIELCKQRGVRWYIGFSVESDNFGNRGKIEAFTNKELEFIENTLKRIGYFETKHIVNWKWAKAVYTNQMPLFSCFMGTRAITVDSDGEVYPCGGGQENHLKPILSMGNVKEYNGNLEKLLYNKKALKVLKSIEEKKCQPCSLLCAHKTIFPWGKGTGM
ncbi:hypothetical protein CRV00_09265 [Malaciobacter molluscorum]|uniref:radical SAM protein n=1 Tax=Malaciobacter molluscorum TaxID=1032072 RepID=UPI00100B2D03|nr:radical SAM protein [Malaciobacter molluscorum]RXJ93849.1 hypothetical protein CRV00_09265 [Malaciobacter molluscorum]